MISIYEAWARGWKFVQVSNRIWRLKLTQHGWCLRDHSSSGYLTYPQALCEPVHTKWVQDRRTALDHYST